MDLAKESVERKQEYSTSTTRGLHKLGGFAYASRRTRVGQIMSENNVNHQHIDGFMAQMMQLFM
jgi:Uri superfamily endonuclease